jgi:hypothetical protein
MVVALKLHKADALGPLVTGWDGVGWGGMGWDETQRGAWDA